MNQINIPTLASGETYAGAIGDLSGNLYHVILLPGDNDDANWQEQTEWAASIGGHLPTRVEQALMFEKLRDQFKKDWYWSCEVYEPGWAWCQVFLNGVQYGHNQSHELRARAVRRLIIE